MRLIRNGRMRNYVNEIFTIFIISATLVYICRSHGRERIILYKTIMLKRNQTLSKLFVVGFKYLIMIMTLEK